MSDGRSLAATTHPELGQNVGNVHAGRLGTDEQCRSDLSIGSAFCHQLQHLELARRQPCNRTLLRRRRHHETGPVRQGRNSIGQQSRAERDRLLQRSCQHLLGLDTLPRRDQVLAKSQARIRTQMSAAHSAEDVDQAVAAFIEAGKELGVI